MSFDAGAGVGTIGVPPMRESHAGSTVLGGGSGRGHSRDASSPMWGTSNPLASPPMGPVTMLPPVGAGVHRNPSASSQASVSSNSSSNRSHLVPRPPPTVPIVPPQRLPTPASMGVGVSGAPRLNVPGINIGGSSDPFWDPSDMLPPPVSPNPNANKSAPGANTNPNPFLDPDPFVAARPGPQSGLKRENSNGAMSWKSGGALSDESGASRRVVSSVL